MLSTAHLSIQAFSPGCHHPQHILGVSLPIQQVLSLPSSPALLPHPLQGQRGPKPGAGGQLCLNQKTGSTTIKNIFQRHGIPAPLSNNSREGGRLFVEVCEGEGSFIIT
ncbi:hypothetical protein GN956_G24044 [Arapaima gigas]